MTQVRNFYRVAIRAYMARISLNIYSAMAYINKMHICLRAVHLHAIPVTKQYTQAQAREILHLIAVKQRQRIFFLPILMSPIDIKHTLYRLRDYKFLVSSNNSNPYRS